MHTLVSYLTTHTLLCLFFGLHTNILLSEVLFVENISYLIKTINFCTPEPGNNISL